MPDLALVLGTLGALLLLGMISDLVSRRAHVPRVTLLIVSGLVLGPPVLGWLPSLAVEWYPLVSHVALLMVGFLLGRKLSRDKLSEVGRSVVVFSAFEVLGAALFVFGAVLIFGGSLPMALVLAGIAPASAPAAVMNVAEETNAEGPFTDTLLGIVAIDDAWGLVVFSLTLAAASAVAGGGGVLGALEHGGIELGGAILIGVGLGVPAALIVRWLRGSEPMQAEALGVVLLAGGLALWLESSFILAGMLVGATVANLSKRGHAPFEALEQLEWPILVIFFVLAGAEADLSRLAELGLLGAVYVGGRALGLLVGAWTGGTLAKAERQHRLWMGPAIMPQAGVALGMALVAGQRVPALKDSILAIVIGSTILFEVTGPILTRLALGRVGETGGRATHAPSAAE